MNKQWTLLALPLGVLFLAASQAQAATLHQSSFAHSRSGNSCEKTLAAVPAGKTLVLNTISCLVLNANAAQPAYGEISIPGTSFAQYFSAAAVSSAYNMAPVQTITTMFTAGQTPRVRLIYPNSDARGAKCAVRGTMTP